MVFKENNTIAQYYGMVNEFNPVPLDKEIMIVFKNIYDNSLIQMSLGGLIMIEGYDFEIRSENIIIFGRSLEEYSEDNLMITIFKDKYMDDEEL